jgi:hypothetical protein
VALITIEGETTELPWAQPTPPRLRIYAKVPFMDALGHPVIAGNPHNGNARIDLACTLASGKVVLPTVPLIPATTDSSRPNEAEYEAWLYSRGVDGNDQWSALSTFSAGFKLDHENLTPSWEDIRIFNDGEIETLAERDVSVTGDLAVAGNVEANTYTGSGAGLHSLPSGVVTPNSLSSTGSVSLNADTEGNGVGEAALVVNGVTKFRSKQGGASNESSVPIELAKYATGSLPSGAEGWSAWDTTLKRPVFHDGDDYFHVGKPTVVDVRDYHATGDGVTEDTAAILVALAVAQTIRGTLYFPAGTYLVSGVGTEIILISTSIQIKGEGKLNSRIKVKNTTGATTDIFVYMPATASDLDSRGFTFQDMCIEYESPTNGRHALVLDGRTNYIADFLIADSTFYVGSGSSVVMLGPTSGDGVFAGSVERNFMCKAPIIDHGGDTLRVMDNTITGPASDEIYVSLVPGATTFMFCGNNVTCGGGMQINSVGASSGVKIVIERNIFEIYTAGATGSDGAILNLTGITGAGQYLYGTSVHKNHFGAVLGNLLDGIRAVDTAGLTVKDNTYTVPNTKFFVTLLRTFSTELPHNSNLNVSGTGSEYADLGGNTFNAPFKTISATDTLALLDDLAYIPSGTFTLTLAPAAGRVGKLPPLFIKNSGAGTITVDGSGAETIDGSANYSLGTGKYVQLVAISTTAWIVVGNN